MKQKMEALGITPETVTNMPVAADPEDDDEKDPEDT